MPVVSADSLQLSHVKESTPGVTPATPSFKIWRTSGESLTFSPNTSESTELGGSGRTQRPANVTGTTVAGDINFELARFPALDEAIAGVLAAAWGECPLTGAPGGAIDSDRITVGQNLETFTIEKRFVNPAQVEGAMDIDAVADGPGATPTITLSGGPAVGSGVIVTDYIIDGGAPRRAHVPIAPGADTAALATALAAELDKETDISATPAGNVVNLTTTGTSFTSISARAGVDQYFYQRYRGASYSVLNITTSPNNPVTGNVSVVGGEPELDYLPINGATYETAGTGAVFTAPEVMELSMGASLGVTTSCWSQMTIALDSQNRGIPCIGSRGDREVVTGTMAVSVAGDVYFSNQEPLESLLNNESLGDGVITLTNTDGEIYRFDFFDVKVVSGEVTAGGTGQDLTMPMEFNPTPQIVCDDGSSNWEAGVIISKKNSAPTMP